MKIGNLIKDNDPRMVNRVLVIIEDLGTHWRCVNRYYEKTFPVVKIRKDRIHTDNKPRKYGFNLINERDKA